MSDADLSFAGFITHPLTALTGLMTTLATVWDPAWALFSAVWINLGTLMPATSILATTIAPEVPLLPQRPLKVLMVLVGCLYVAKLIDQAVEKYQERNS